MHLFLCGNLWLQKNFSTETTIKINSGIVYLSIYFKHSIFSCSFVDLLQRLGLLQITKRKRMQTQPQKGITCSKFPRNIGNLTLPFLGDNYPIFS